MLWGCSDDATGPGQYDFAPILEAYVDRTVIPTFADLRTRTAGLSQAAVALDADPTQENLDAAAQAWTQAREPWEASGAFRFGPVAFLGLDSSVDGWPFDRAQLAEVLAGGAPITVELVRDGLSETVRGFHAVEFLLFRDGQPRMVQTLPDRERDYLVAVSQVLADDAALLHDAWMSGVEAVGSQPFGDEIRYAGAPGSRYGSQVEVALEIVEGMIEVADDVGSERIGEPFRRADPTLVESWLSWNSLADFANSLRSVQNAYLGGFDEENRSFGLASFVVSHDATLDQRIVTEMETAIGALGQIPAPFGNNLDAAPEIEAAMDALNALVASLRSDLKPLVQGAG